ncbi:hypothetical protein ABXJ56_15590 [Microbacterium chocolatum]|uniref:hypothetical protein n=1 Tax=Microbacterium aurantiacum TaxID=162393 RepID=UPI00338E2845
MKFRRWAAVGACIAVAGAALVAPSIASAQEPHVLEHKLRVTPTSAATTSPPKPDESLTLSDALPEPLTASSYDDPGERLALPVVTGTLLETATSIETSLKDDPQFNVVEILPDRSGIGVWWFGEPNATLKELLTNSEVAISVQQTKFLPADLRKARDQLLAEHESLIAIVTIPKEGDGVEVQLTSNADAGSRRAAEDAVIEEFSQRVGLPVTIEGRATVDLASRKNDIYVLGGAKVWRWNGSTLVGSCTTGFPAQNAAGAKGVMFAAHCQSGQWVRYPNDTGATVFPYGNNGTSSLSTVAYDGAIIETTFNNPGFYTGNSTSATYTALNGAATPPVGAEICYSGQPSGLICGNIVQSKSTVNVTGFGSVTGYLTQQSVNTPAVGNGDSGGPGYMLVNVGGTLKRYGATIISATVNASVNCSGEPGFGDPNVSPYFRWCSSTVLSTGVTDISSALGWTLTTTP